MLRQGQDALVPESGLPALIFLYQVVLRILIPEERIYSKHIAHGYISSLRITVAMAAAILGASSFLKVLRTYSAMVW